MLRVNEVFCYSYMMFVTYLLSVNGQLVDKIHIGVIYDEYFDIEQFDLKGALNSYLDVMVYTLEQSFTNGSSYESPEWTITVRKFSLDEVCSLIELGARMIASLTSCSVAQYIDSITSRHHILHYAIPRPMCLERPSMPEGETMHTMWYQPEARDLANALYKINEFENADRGLILGNGQSNLPKLLMEMSSESVSLGQKFKPVYVTQDFATVDDKKSGFPGTSTDRISLDNILTALSDKTGTTSGVPSMSHVIVMMPQSGVIELLAKVVLYPTAAKKYMWIFGEPVDVPIKTMLKLLSAHPIKTMNVAFFRYLPILHQEDCNDDSMNKLLRDTAIHFGYCDYSPLPERVAILITVMNLYAHVRHYTTNYYAPHTPDILCSAIPTQTDQAGPIALNLSKELGVLHKFSGLTFYALETNADNVTRFVATARYGDNSITQTEDGVEVGKQALVSGLFPNRFRNFTNQMLTVGMVLVPPFVMDYQLSPSGYLTKARGMMIDLMDILAERFNFRYRIYPASDGHFGEFSLRGEWTGLIGDLQKKRIDLAGSCLVQNKERDSAGSFLGHVLDGRLAILIAKPTTEGKLFRLFQIYQPEVMGIFVLCAIVSTAMCYLYERYSPYSLRNQITSSPPIPERFHFLEQMWNICKCSIHQCILRYPNNPSSRVVLLAQWVMIFLLFSAWQADITSFLTRSNYKPRIGSLLDLAADTTLKPLIVRGTGVYEFFQESNTKQAFQDILRRVNDENLVVPNTSTAISMLIDNPDYVVVGDYETLRYAELTYCQKLMLINTEVVMGQQSIMTLSDVDWVKPFSTYLDQLKEGGVVDALTMRWWELNTVCTVNQLNYRSLNIEALEELYILVAVLVGIGVILISSEWFWAGVLWPQIRRRREKRAAQRARRERRIRRSQAIQARKSTAVELADNSEAGKPE